MAASELEIEPDLNKAPPHVEGELLKQNTKAILGRRGWRKYYFIVLNDRLQYFRKLEECKSQKEPVAFIRMSQVTEITEVIFSGVPRNHHLNCGFSLTAFHPNTQQQISLNLLAETPENMRYWVHALRYIKAYWSKMKIRDTVISEEQERMLLERILSEEENEREDDLFGEVTLGEDAQPSSAEDSIISIMVCFADGTKAKINLSPAETTSDLLEKEEVKENLTSSASYLWMVDHRGNDSILDPRDTPALYQSKAKKFYVLDHSHRVLVVFYNRRQDFEIITVPSYANASDILDDRDLSVQLDISGIANRALFLKTQDDEHIFTNLESPCDVLFEVDEDGVLRRQPVGTLFVRNKALGGGRRTAKLTQRINRTKRQLVKTPSNESAKFLEQITEEEAAQSKALDMLLMKKTQGTITASPKSSVRDSLNLEDDWVIPEAEDFERHDSNGSRESNRDSRGFEDSIVSQPPGERSSSLKSGRPRAAAIDLPKRGRSGNQKGSPKIGGDRSRLGSSPSSSPRPSPSTSPKHSRSKSPRRLPEVPPQSDKQPSPEDSGPFRRRGASGNLGSKRGSNSPAAPSSPHRSLRGKGPTINIQSISSHDVHVLVEERKVHSPTIKRARSPSIRNVFENVTDSRSSSFGITSSDSSISSLSISSTSSLTTTAPMARTSTRADQPSVEVSSTHQTTPMLAAPTASDEKRLEEMFSRTFQQEQEEMNSKNYRPRDTLSEKVKALSGTNGERKEKKEEEEEESSSAEPLRPMVIDFTKLQSPVSEESVDNQAGQQQQSGPSRESESSDTSSTPVVAAVRSPAPINVPSPSLLKVILLQSSEVSDSVMTETKPVDFISLSGVCLMNNRGTWKIQEGCNFHDPLPFDCDDHTESFPLPGGIRAIYNHTHKRWHVLPPPATSAPTPSGDEAGSMIDSAEYHPPSETGSEGREGAEERLYNAKKFIITEIGSAFHEIMIQFEKSRDLAEKKRIGSDMTNVAMGHMIRGRFCSALAALVLDGLRPYRLEGLVTDDIWKVTVAFCNEAHSSTSSSVVFPAFDRQVLQPINALKTLMKDNNIRFRTFICLSMSKGMLTAWLEALPKQKSILRKYYLPTSFLRLVSESELFAKLYQQMLLTLEPMLHLPFDLSIDFEAKQEEEARLRVARQQQEMSRVSMSPVPPKRTSSPEGSPQMRPSVVIKTHAATGQRTTAGNVISAVWEKSPLHGVVQTEAGLEEETDSNDQMSSIKTLREIQSNVQQQSIQNSQSPNENSSPTNSTLQQQNQLIQQQQQAPPTQQQQGQNNRTGRGSWLKKIIDDGIQQLNMGGAFTGTPKQRVVQQTQPQQKLPAKSSEMRVEALYNNIGEDADELSFTRGDVMVVKEQINAEWLICELENHSGIVPANYVKTI